MTNGQGSAEPLSGAPPPPDRWKPSRRMLAMRCQPGWAGVRLGGAEQPGSPVSRGQQQVKHRRHELDRQLDAARSTGLGRERDISEPESRAE